MVVDEILSEVEGLRFDREALLTVLASFGLSFGHATSEL